MDFVIASSLMSMYFCLRMQRDNLTIYLQSHIRHIIPFWFFKRFRSCIKTWLSLKKYDWSPHCIFKIDLYFMGSLWSTIICTRWVCLCSLPVSLYLRSNCSVWLQSVFDGGFYYLFWVLFLFLYFARKIRGLSISLFFMIRFIIIHKAFSLRYLIKKV